MNTIDIPTYTAIDQINDQYLTRAELAKRWSISKITLSHWDAQGKNPVTIYRFGNGPKAPIRYRFSEILSVEQNSVLQLPGA